MSQRDTKDIDKVFLQWKKDIEKDEDFLSRAEKMKEALKKGLNTKKDKDAFEDIFSFFKRRYEIKKDFDLKTLYIYMTKVKGWPDFDYNVYARFLTLIGLCGFDFQEI